MSVGKIKFRRLSHDLDRRQNIADCFTTLKKVFNSKKEGKMLSIPEGVSNAPQIRSGKIGQKSKKVKMPLYVVLLLVLLFVRYYHTVIFDLGPLTGFETLKQSY